MTNEFVEELVMSVKETESDFIFQTVQPFCENIIQKEISKKDLEQALIQYYKQQPCVDCVLDKIRAEIENDWQLKEYPSSPFSCGLKRAIEILDKYKAESEE